MAQTLQPAQDSAPSDPQNLIARGERHRTVEVSAPFWADYLTGVTAQLRPNQDVGSNPKFPDAAIRITVRELAGNELGLLGKGGGAFNLSSLALGGDPFKRAVDQSVHMKARDDIAAYGMTSDEIRQKSAKQGYYESPAHDAWAAAAEARTGGRLTAAWWKHFDPYGGTNGNGPEILPTGEYPHAASRIAMGHDTDWSLGRYFKAGPMAALHMAKGEPKELGRYGLVNTALRPQIDFYTYGHADWNVDYRHGRKVSQTDGGTLAIASNESTRPERTDLHAQAYDKLPNGLFNNAERDVVALAIATRAQAEGFKSIDHVVSSTRDARQLFAVQGDLADPAHRKTLIDGAEAARQPFDQTLALTASAFKQPDNQVVASAPMQEPTRVQRM